jgi:hypothetical protein
MWNIAFPTCDKVEMINPAQLYQMDLKSNLETKRMTAPQKEVFGSGIRSK